MLLTIYKSGGVFRTLAVLSVRDRDPSHEQTLALGPTQHDFVKRSAAAARTTERFKAVQVSLINSTRDSNSSRAILS